MNFVKGFLCIYWDSHMVFIFQFVNVVYHIDWFVNIEESSHPWDKTHLAIMYDLFYMLLDSVCWNKMTVLKTIIVWQCMGYIPKWHQ